MAEDWPTNQFKVINSKIGQISISTPIRSNCISGGQSRQGRGRATVYALFALFGLLGSVSLFADPATEPIPKPQRPDYDKIIEAYGIVIANDPASVGAYSQRGLAKFSKGDLDGAATDLDQALALDSHWLPALAVRLEIRQKKGDVQGAIEDCGTILSVAPKAALVWNTRGLLRMNKGDLDGALQDLAKAIELAPGSSSAYASRAAIYLRKRAFHDALENFNHAIETDPSAAVYGLRATCKLSLNDTGGAKIDFRKTIEIDPLNASAFHGLGQVEMHEGNLNTAITNFSRALQINGGLAWSYLLRGVAEIGTGAYRESIRDLLQFERINLNQQDAAEGFLWVARALNDAKDDANAELSAYLDQRKTDDEWFLKKAAFFLDRDSEETFLQKSALGSGQLCEAYFYAGMKRLAANDRVVAVDYLRRCIAFEIRDFIEDELARAMLKELENAGK
jgi:tetratricopeptide (TPR) repeat protein